MFAVSVVESPFFVLDRFPASSASFHPTRWCCGCGRLWRDENRRQPPRLQPVRAVGQQNSSSRRLGADLLREEVRAQPPLPTFDSCAPAPPSTPRDPLSVPGSVASRSGPSTRRTSTFASSRPRPRSHSCSCPPPTRLPPHSHRHALAGTLPRCSSTLLSGASRCRSPSTI